MPQPIPASDDSERKVKELKEVNPKTLPSAIP